MVLSRLELDRCQALSRQFLRLIQFYCCLVLHDIFLHDDLVDDHALWTGLPLIRVWRVGPQRTNTAARQWLPHLTGL